MQRSRDPAHPAATDESGDAYAMTDECARCGSPVPAEEWHPVATVRDDDGTVEIYDFCSEACRTAWVDVENADD